MKKILFLIFILNSLMGYSQRSYQPKDFQRLFPSGFDIENLTTYGFSGSVFSDVNNLAFSNPALITHFDKMQVGLSYHLHSFISDYFYGNVSLERNKSYLPSNIIFIYPYGSNTFSISYSQRYASAMNSGTFIVTTVDQPDGTGETFTPVAQFTVHNYGISAGKFYSSVLSGNDRLDFGLQLSLSHLQYNFEFNNSDDLYEKFNGFQPGLSVGITYSPFSELNVGVHYTHNIRFSGESEINSSSLRRAEDDGSPRGGLYSVTTSSPILQDVPSKLSLGLSWMAVNDLTTWFQYSRENWAVIADNFSDSHAYSSGISWTGFENYKMNAGINFIDQTNLSGFFQTNYFSALYSTFGIQYQLDAFNIQFSLADSFHDWLGDSYKTDHRRKQTILKFGFGYAF